MPHELPEDIREWPNDPFAILGVERGADDLTVRRAYTQLIRRFKPEHHPVEFSKIRAAYEACQQQASWYRHDVNDEPDEPEVVEVPLPKWATPAVDVAQNVVNQLWNKAISGNLAEAYNGLVVEAFSNSDVSLRLYWLLMIDSTLDPNRTRHDWLWNALSHAPLQDSALELYKRELQTDPTVALDEPYTEIFTIPIDVPKLIELARCQIAAAARTGRYSLIEFNMKQLKSVLGIDNDFAWVSLIVTVLEIEWPVKNQPNFLKAFCTEELRLLKHLELHNSYLFDRVDETAYWRTEAAVFQGAGMSEFIRLIGMIRANGDLVSRAEIVDVLSPIAEQPHAYLERFDRAKELSVNVVLLAATIIGRYYRDEGDSFRSDILRGYIRNVYKRSELRLRDLRLIILRDLIRDRIHPSELAAACSTDKKPRIRDFSEFLEHDTSLRIVWLASCICPAKHMTNSLREFWSRIRD